MDLTHEISNNQYSRFFTARSPYINVIYPITESFEPPLNLIITWESGYFNNFYFPNVKIDLYKSGVYNSTIVSSTSNDGIYNWITESLSGGTYTIKISVVNCENIYGFSGSFTIISSEINPWILTNFYYGENIPYTDKAWILTNYDYPLNTNTDTYPNGWVLAWYETFINIYPGNVINQSVGAPGVTITWDTISGVTINNVKIELVNGTIIVASTPNTGSYYWVINGIIPNQTVKLLITNTDGVGYGESTNTFTINPFT